MPNYSNDLPVGAVLPTLASYNTTNIVGLAKKGYFFCDGSLNYASDSPVLADALKTSWGGAIGDDGSVYTFNLPPLTNCSKPLFIRGVDPAAKNDAEAHGRISIAAGGATGAQVGSFQDYATACPTQGNEFTTDTQGAHTHQYNGIGDYHRHYRSAGAQNELEDSTGLTTNSAGEHNHLLGAGNGSGGNPTTAPVSISLNWIVKQEL